MGSLIKVHIWYQTNDSTTYLELTEMRTNISDELEDIKSKIERLSTGAESHSSPDIAMNIVIRGLPVTPNENVSNKVNAMFKDTLKVAGVSCASAERKIVNSGSKPGVVIAKMRSHEDKRKVMLKKANLKSNRQHSSVFISHDQSHADRLMSNNFRTILSAIRNHDLQVKGSRVVKRDHRTGINDGTHAGGTAPQPQEWRQQDSRRGGPRVSGNHGNSHRVNGYRGNASGSNGRRGDVRGQNSRR